MPRKAVSKRPSEPAGRDPMEQLVSSFFQIIGEDESREGLVETPARVRLACDEVFAGYRQDPKTILKTFSEDVQLTLYRRQESRPSPRKRNAKKQNEIGRAHV